jgi:hypothetical protein
MFRARIFTSSAVVVAFAVAGCGESSKSTAATSSTIQFTNPRIPVSTQQLIAKTDAACAKIHAMFTGYTVTTQPSLARAAASIAPMETQTVNGLKKLSPSSSPASLRSDWETIVRSLDTLATNTARVGTYAQQNDLVSARPLIAETNNARLRILTVAERSGFTGCKVIVR